MNPPPVHRMTLAEPAHGNEAAASLFAEYYGFITLQKAQPLWPDADASQVSDFLWEKGELHHHLVLSKTLNCLCLNADPDSN